MGGPGAFAAIWEAVALIPHPRSGGRQMLTLLGGLRAVGLGSPVFPRPFRLQL